MSVEVSSHVHAAHVLTTESLYHHSLFYDVTAPVTLINMQGPPGSPTGTQPPDA